MDRPVALVTGAGSGIGAAICHGLAKSGYAITLSGRTAERLTATAGGLVTETLVHTCDVREEAQINGLVNATVERFGRLDLLVNNAGIFQPTPIEEATADGWDDVLSTNLRSAFLASRFAWPWLKESKGQVFNLSSISATMGFAGGAAYCASKFGMNGLSAVLAVEGKPHGIRVLTLCPAQVATPIWEVRAEPEQLDRMMTAEQIADIVLFMVNTPRNIDLSPLVVTNTKSPWDG